MLAPPVARHLPRYVLTRRRPVVFPFAALSSQPVSEAASQGRTAGRCDCLSEKTREDLLRASGRAYLRLACATRLSASFGSMGSIYFRSRGSAVSVANLSLVGSVSRESSRADISRRSCPADVSLFCPHRSLTGYCLCLCAMLPFAPLRVAQI